MGFRHGWKWPLEQSGRNLNESCPQALFEVYRYSCKVKMALWLHLFGFRCSKDLGYMWGEKMEMVWNKWVSWFLGNGRRGSLVILLGLPSDNYLIMCWGQHIPGNKDQPQFWTHLLFSSHWKTKSQWRKSDQIRAIYCAADPVTPIFNSLPPLPYPAFLEKCKITAESQHSLPTEAHLVIPMDLFSLHSSWSNGGPFINSLNKWVKNQWAGISHHWLMSGH